MWYSDDGQWVDFDAAATPVVAYRSGYYPAPYDGYYYPYDSGPGYGTGYYPGVAVGVWPYGVNVGVGPRVGVGVWGPRGAVRICRIYVGW